MEHWDAISAERLALADDLDGLTDAQWETPSLCGDWTVRQVIGHLVATPQLSPRRLIVAVARARGSLDKANSALAIREARRATDELIAAIRAMAGERFTPPMFGSEAPLTDIVIHGFDVRVPLGLVRSHPADTLAHVLDFLMTRKARFGFVPRRLPDVRLVATDLDRSWGEGPEVEGTGADLIVTISGRPVRVHALSGPAHPALVAWAGG